MSFSRLQSESLGPGSSSRVEKIHSSLSAKQGNISLIKFRKRFFKFSLVLFRESASDEETFSESQQPSGQDNRRVEQVADVDVAGK